jgi:carboxyl-terminal processing protease
MKRHTLFIILLLISTLAPAQTDTTGAIDSADLFRESRQKIDRAFHLINRFYVDTVDFGMLTEKAIIEMLKQLDPHSNYFTADQIRRANEGLEGSFQGIGVEYQIMDDTAVIVMVHSDGPADQGGLRQGDRLIVIDGESAAGSHISNAWISGKVRGPGGSTVLLTVSRRGVVDPVQLTLTRGTIRTYSMDAAFMLDDRTGYINISRFMRTTIQEFEDALADLKHQGMKRLVLDLRGNSGGYLTAAVELADHFLRRDRLIVYTEGHNHPRTEYRSTARGKFKRGRLAVLIDERSASASEIVTGAIQDWDRGVVIGRRTYGKGLVQKPYSFADGSAVRLTIARYYTPLGRSIQRPYDQGREKYYEELNEKIRRGVYSNVDSIGLPDSLRFITPGGKVVYGGGGVMPDILIPADTTGRSDLITTLNRRQMYNRFFLEHLSIAKDSLLLIFPDAYSYSQNAHLVNDALAPFLQFVSAHGIDVPDTLMHGQQFVIERQMQSTLGRLLYGQQGALHIQSKYDPVIIKALEVISDNRSVQHFLLDPEDNEGENEEGT